MTPSQRSYLESMASEPMACLDVMPGSSKRCVQRLIDGGFAKRISMPDRRDDYYTITDAGKVALQQTPGA